MATAPPTYEDTIREASPGAPPSYTDLFPMRELKSEVSHAREDGLSPSLPLNICGLICKSVACGVCYLLLAILPLSMIIMGSIYYHQCDIEPRVPLFLVVFGSAALLQTLLHMVKMCLCRKKDDDRDNTKEKGGNFCESLLTLFLIVWIFVGSYYTFRSFNPWYNDGQMSCSGDSPSSNCCDPPVMYFSFVTLLLMYGVTALACCFCCCCICCATLIASAGSNRD